MTIDNIEYNDAEIGWAAGLFEGEGCITKGSINSIHLELTSTDLDVLQKYFKIVGFGKIYGPFRCKAYKSYYKDTYRWRCFRKRDVLLFYKLIGPLLCQRRSNRLEELKPLLTKFGNTGTKRKPYNYKKKQNINSDMLYNSNGDGT